MIYVIPVLIILILISAAKNGTPAYQSFIIGAEEGMKTVISILPALIAVLSAAAMLRQSGALDSLARLLSPITDFLQVPSELLPLVLIRPLSGSGAIGLLTDTVKTYGADSQIARTACILCASTETTFYTVMVYFRRTKVKYTKKVLIAAIFGDLVGIFCACRLSKIFF
ncbi:MAG: spore maturation protein [Clostridiales bacterium]|nr:spore maturation protein [Clostridiales bacterium]